VHPLRMKQKSFYLIDILMNISNQFLLLCLYHFFTCVWLTRIIIYNVKNVGAFGRVLVEFTQNQRNMWRICFCFFSFVAMEKRDQFDQLTSINNYSWYVSRNYRCDTVICDRFLRNKVLKTDYDWKDLLDTG